MKVRILQTAAYSDFSTMPAKLGAKKLHEGDVVDFPDYYALDIVASGLAEKVVLNAPLETPLEEPEVKKARRGRHPKTDTQDVIGEEK